MALFNDDLNKTAVNMGRIIKMLDNLEKTINDGGDFLENKETFFVIAYVCRVGILDRIESNIWSLKQPINIPTGLFSFTKETIDSGLKLTVERLKSISQKNDYTNKAVNSILAKQEAFYIFERTLPLGTKNKF